MNRSVPSLLHEGINDTDYLQKLEIFNNYFHLVFTISSSTPLPSLTKCSIPDIVLIYIDSHGVKCLLDSVDIHKSAGSDNIPSCLLKELSTEFSPNVTFIFKLLYQCCVPKEWKTAKIVPIYKKVTVVYMVSIAQYH